MHFRYDMPFIRGTGLRTSGFAAAAKRTSLFPFEKLLNVVEGVTLVLRPDGRAHRLC